MEIIQYFNKNTLKKVETLVVFCLLLFFPRDLVLPFNPLIIRALSYLLIPTLFFCYWKRVAYMFLRDKILLVLLGFSMLSVIWSSVPSVTFLLARGLLLTCMFSGYLVSRYTLSEQIRLWAGVLTVWGGLSLLVEVIFPSYGSNLEFWTGIFSYKNGLGSSMALGFIISALNLISPKRTRIFTFLSTLVCLSLVLLSEAKTSLLIVLLTLLLLPLYILSRLKFELKAVLCCFSTVISISMLVLITTNIETIVVDWLGRDLTLTGRSSLWQAIIRQGMERPLFGHGLGAFWSTEKSLDAFFENQWPPLPSTGAYIESFPSHNGYVDIFLGVGFLGLALFTLNLLMVVSRTLFLVFYERTAEAFWMFEVLVIIIVSNLTQVGTLLVGGNIFWILYITVALASAAKYEKVLGKSQS